MRKLVEHLIGGCALTALVLSGQDAKKRPQFDGVADRAMYDECRRWTDTLIEALQTRDALERTVVVGFGPVPGRVAANLCLVEAIVHGWDVGQSTGQQSDFASATVDEALEFSRGMMGQVPPERSPFDPARPVSEDAPSLDRLVALLGRTPGRATTQP